MSKMQAIVRRKSLDVMDVVEDELIIDSQSSAMDEDDDAVVCRTPSDTPSANALRQSASSDKPKKHSKSQQQAPLWEQLPAELRQHIIAHFDTKSLRVGSQVCHEWNFFCNEEKLWQARCREEFGLMSKPENRSWKWLYRCRSVPFQKGCNMTHGYLESDDPKGSYFGEWNNDSFHGMGFFEWSMHGLKYAGEYAHGLRCGFGVLSWKNGDRYIGDFDQDMKHGHGTFYWSNGDVYCGEYVRDKKQGRGMITWGSHPGECYDGEWITDKKQGFGKYFWSNGGSYEGHWVDNKRHGSGIERWPSGSVYEGGWLENEMHGWGHKICTRDGRPDGFYEGPFQDGRAHGRGFRVYEDGAKYEGDYVADKRVGFGSYTWPDGEKFSGTWTVGRERGFFTCKTGQVYYQEWFEDKLKEERRTGAELYQIPFSTIKCTE